MNINRGGGPFGAVVVKDGKMFSCCANRVICENETTAQAEILAIRDGCTLLGSWDLSDCEIYSSCEPCPMYLGAIYWAGIPVFYYGANSEYANVAGFDDSAIYNEIALNPDKRKIKMQNILREKAVEGFKKWVGFEEKE